MANFNKSFNFRNGVQVDDDNFVVNPNGQVGIGSTVPTEFFDLHGNAVITGSTATGSINAGIGTVGVLTATTAGVGTLAVDEIQIDGLSLRTIVGYHTVGWNISYAYGGDADPGQYGSSSGISTTIKVGIGTTQAIGKYDLLVGADPENGRFNGGGVAVAYGHIHAAGIITASQHFVGVASLITQIDATNIEYGTINDARLPDTITSNIVGDVTGTATTARSLTDHPAIAVTSIVATGIITANTLDADFIYGETVDLTGATIDGANLGVVTSHQLSADNIVVGLSTITSDLHLSGGSKIGIGSQTPAKTIDIIRDNASVNIESPDFPASLHVTSNTNDVAVALSAFVDTNIDIDSVSNTNVTIDSLNSSNIDINSSNSSNIDLISGIGSANLYINAPISQAAVSIGASETSILRVNSYYSDGTISVGASGSANLLVHSEEDLANVDITSKGVASLDLASSEAGATISVSAAGVADLNVRSTESSSSNEFRGSQSASLDLTADTNTASFSVTSPQSASVDVNSGIDSARLRVTGNQDANVRVHSDASTAGVDISGYGPVDVEVLSATDNVTLDINASGIASAQIRSQTSTADLDIVADNGRANLDIVSLNNESRIRFSSYTGVADTSAMIRFGADAGFFDIINNDVGDIRFVIDNTPAGLNTGNFAWKYGSVTEQNILTLTYDGRLGVGTGITDPTEILQVGGGLTVSSKSYFGDGLSATGNIIAEDGYNFIGDASQLSNVYSALPNPLRIPIDNGTSAAGVSTFKTLHIFDTDIGMPPLPLKGQIGISSIAIGNNDPQVDIDARSCIASVAGVGIGTTVNQMIIDGQVQMLCDGIAQFNKVAIGATHTSYGLDLSAQVVDIRDNSLIFLGDCNIAMGIDPTPTDTNPGNIAFVNKSTIYYAEDEAAHTAGEGKGRALIDYGAVGAASSLGAIILPNVTETEKNSIRNFVTSGDPVPGSLIFNTTRNKFQGYDGSNWVDLH